MNQSGSQVAVEHRHLPTRRYTARPDDAAEFRAVIATMRNVPRESVASMADMFHLLRRLGGKLAAIADRLEVVEQPERRPVRQQLGQRPAVDARAVAEGVFGKRPTRHQIRSIMTRSGRAVRVVERQAGQMELGL